MSRRNTNSRALRQLAISFLSDLAKELDLYDVDQGDLSTSLVRQWITYDGKALLCFRDEEVRASLVRSPAGQLSVSAQVSRSNWRKRLRDDWRIDEEALPEIFAQLNRGQSIEAVNLEGLPIRIWVNPQEGSHHVESLADESATPLPPRDLHKIAHATLEDHFGEELAGEEVDALAASIARQWRNYDGYACLFLKPGVQLCLRFEEHPDGGCGVKARSDQVHLEELLTSLGIDSEELPEIVARINLGQQVEFVSRDGVPSLLSHDPKARRIAVRKSKRADSSTG